jgi:hypothetical protein
MNMKQPSYFLSLLACFIGNNLGFVVAFQQHTPLSLMQMASCTSKAITIIPFAAMSPEEERAAALSDYLAKAHEEKLRVIKEVEQKKNQEIDQLKQQIAELKSQPTASSSAVVMVNGADTIAVKALDDMNKEELMAKILQYQDFMRQYMIDAQEQKYRAVQEAQAAAQKKLSESLSLLGLSPATADTSGATLTLSSVAESPLYTARNVAVTKAAAAGSQSRWGPMEVQRASAGVSGHSISVTKINGSSAPIAATMPVNGASVPVMNTPEPVVVPVPPEVAEADHGLRSDGSIGGLTLAERIYFGSNAAPATAAATTTATASSTTTNPMEVLYQKRNIKVVQAAKAGKSYRWGEQEVERVSNIVATTAAQLPSSGSASSTQPPQRINFGASILGQK